MELVKFNIRVYGLLIDEGRILISDEFEHGEYFSKFPGGGLELGEGLIDGLKREFMEEMNLAIEITEHFYTTDFFIVSKFHRQYQLISVYYLVKPLHSYPFKISDSAFDFLPPEKLAQSFRFKSIGEITEEDVTFPIDKHVVKLLKEKFNA